MSSCLTLPSEASAEIKILRSRFIAVVVPVRNVEEFKALLARISAEHRTANHHCWAYVLGSDGETTHCSDAGEPSGSAGKPILNVLRRNRLSNVGAVVTRYFGGIKLGVRGLIEAYGEAVETALGEAHPEPLVNRVSWRVECPYDLLETLKHRLRVVPADCADFEFDTGVKFSAIASEDDRGKCEGVLADFAAGGRVTYRPVET
jgi:uncharacterized YigZ family protein